MNETKKMVCVTLRSPMLGWCDVVGLLTVGKEYEVTLLEDPDKYKDRTQCEVTDDRGGRRRLLLGHFKEIETGLILRVQAVVKCPACGRSMAGRDMHQVWEGEKTCRVIKYFGVTYEDSWGLR